MMARIGTVVAATIVGTLFMPGIGTVVGFVIGVVMAVKV